MIRFMQPTDYEEVFDLWQGVEGFRIRKIDDSASYIYTFLKKNPRLSLVTVIDEEIVGTVLCGHDGRTANVYHVCVKYTHRRKGIASAMIKKITELLNEVGISTIYLQASKENEIGNTFWLSLGWEMQEKMNNYYYPLNELNIVRLV